MIGASARMNGIDESNPTCLQPVAFIGGFPVMQGLHPPLRGGVPDARRGALLCGCRGNREVDFERKKLKDWGPEVNEK